MNEVEKKFPNASASFRRRNPHLFSAPVGAIQGAQREQAAQDALGRTTKRKPKGVGGVDNQPRFRVVFVSFRKTLLDSDNLATGCKGLRDAIANWLELDDSDELIDWNYGQVQTRGEEGVAVRIEKL